MPFPSGRVDVDSEQWWTQEEEVTMRAMGLEERTTGVEPGRFAANPEHGRQ